MSRTSYLLPVVFLFLACGVRPERSILDQFFNASRLRDRTAASKFSTVILEPLDQGIVTDYTIAGVAEQGATKTVTVAAKVKKRDGRVVPETLLVLMQRADAAHRAARWMITGIVEK